MRCGLWLDPCRVLICGCGARLCGRMAVSAGCSQGTSQLGLLSFRGQKLFPFLVCAVQWPRSLWGPWDSRDHFPEVGLLMCPSKLKWLSRCPLTVQSRIVLQAWRQVRDPFPLLTHPYITLVIIILTTDTSSASEDEGSLRRPGRLTSTLLQSHSGIEPWLDRVIQGSSTSSSASSTSSHPGGRPAAAPSASTALAGLTAHAHIGQ
jgi:hypothetical protein